jgi:hypothetical protein
MTIRACGTLQGLVNDLFVEVRVETYFPKDGIVQVVKEPLQSCSDGAGT